MTTLSSTWKPLLWIMLIWLAHFFLPYALMLIFPEAKIVGLLTFLMGILGLGIIFLVYRSSRSERRGAMLMAAILSGIAVAWQSLVGILS